jgi:hypothetical protein
MTVSARLVGFCRSMPDVYTFVTPIFADERGNKIAQIPDRDSGKISGFAATDIDYGFTPVDFDFSVMVGGAFLYGFEMSHDSVAIGHARMLARHLKETLNQTTNFRTAKPRTAAAIERFSDFACRRPANAAECYLFELAPLAPENSYVLTSSLCNTTRDQTGGIPRTQSQWQAEVLRSASGNHEQYINAHRATEHRLELLTASSQNSEKARLSLEAALSTVLLGSTITSGGLMFRGTLICHTCLFRLVLRYPTQSSVDKLAELADSLTNAWASAGETESAIRMEAMDVVQRILVSDDSVWDTDRVRTHHLRLLSHLEADVRFAKRCQGMLRQLMISQRLFQDDEVRGWAAENSLFPRIIENAILSGELSRLQSLE